jgi:hypothetical protein
METILDAVLNDIKERYGLKKLEQVPFYASMTPHIVDATEDENDDTVMLYEKIYLLDQDGNKITEVEKEDAVFQTLEILGEDALSVLYVLSIDFEEISVNPGFVS